MQIDDEAHDDWFIDNASVDATQTYAYDALGRLVQATGRERDTQTYGYGPPPSASVVELAHKPTAYTRRYSYDGVGNVTETKSVGQWTRSFSYAGTDNRLASTTVSGTTTSFAYTNRGAMTTMPHLGGGAVTWDEVDHIRTLALPAGNSAHYTYDATRERVRKVVEKGAITEERIYLGSYEVFRKYSSGVLQDERHTLHVHDPGAGKRVLMVERLTLEGGVSKPGTPRYRYQLCNHLGTAAVETDEAGDVITYEEFYPYGGLAWTAEKSGIQVSAKRYRYIGKERDEESGLNYHSARYYMPWLGRWCSADPGGLIDGVGRYGYAQGRPMSGTDPSGLSFHAEVDDGGSGQHPKKETLQPIKDPPWTNVPPEVLEQIEEERDRGRGGVRLLPGDPPPDRAAFVDPNTGDGVLNGTYGYWRTLDLKAENDKHTRVQEGIKNGGPGVWMGVTPGLMTGDVDASLRGAAAGSLMDGIMDIRGGGAAPFSGPGQRARETGVADVPGRQREETSLPRPSDVGGASQKALQAERSRLVGVLRRRLRQQGGFADEGVPIILDENLQAAAAPALRKRGFNVRTVEEVFGRFGVKDPEIIKYGTPTRLALAF